MAQPNPSSTPSSPRARPPELSTTPLAAAASSIASPPSLTPRPDSSHRSSFVDNLRYPPSPRARRQPSFSGVALTELIMNPPLKGSHVDPRFAGRDWRGVQVHEIIDPDETRFVELDTSIEDTTKLLVRSGAPNVVLVRESCRTRTAIGLFGFDDLNAYLLLVLGMTQPDEPAALIADRARNGEVLPLRDIRDHLGRSEEPTFLAHTADLTKAMELLGSGVHRIIICREGTSEAIGVLSQLRLVRFFWDNHQSFAVTESLYSRSLQELQLGAKEVVSINGDRPLSEALRKMHEGGITSLPVLDNHRNVVGNISHVDVRLLTDTSSIPLLSSSCIHFVSVILSERGVEDGKDAYPVYHVTPSSTLAHTVAKLCATRSHRMWIVDMPSPGSSVPPSPGAASTAMPAFGPQHANGSATRAARAGSGPEHAMTPGPPFTSTAPGVSIGAAQLPGAALSGRLTGVVSLTDILNLLARASGLQPADPEETRRLRRRSSSSSTRPALDAPQDVRPSSEAIRSSIEIGRSSSQRGRKGP